MTRAVDPIKDSDESRKPDALRSVNGQGARPDPKSGTKQSPKVELPKATIAHAAMADRIDAALVGLEQVKTAFIDDPLKSMDTLQYQLLGQNYQKEELAQKLPELAAEMLRQYQQGFRFEVLQTLKRFGKEQQLEILKLIFSSSPEAAQGLGALLQNLWQKFSISDFYQRVMSDETVVGIFNRSERTDMQTQVKDNQLPGVALLALRNLRTLAEDGLKNLAQAGLVLGQNTKEMVGLAKGLLKDDPENAQLQEIFRSVRRLSKVFKEAGRNLLELGRLPRQEAAFFLQNIIEALGNQTDLVKQSLQGFMDQVAKVADKSMLQQIIDLVQENLDKLSMEAARLIREKAESGQLLQIKRAATATINDSLQNQGKLPLDQHIFGSGSEFNQEDVAELINSTYELAIDTENLKIATKFTFDTILNTVNKEKEEQRRLIEQKLADAREVAKFAEEFGQKLKEQSKRLAKAEQLKALDALRNNISFYKNILADLKNISPDRLEWYRSLLDTAEQRNIAQQLVQIKTQDM